MKYLSIKEFSEIWGVSPTMVRKYCLQNRIPGAKRKDGVWIIPDTAKKAGGKGIDWVPFRKASTAGV